MLTWNRFCFPKSYIIACTPEPRLHFLLDTFDTTLLNNNIELVVLKLKIELSPPANFPHTKPPHISHISPPPRPENLI